MKRDTFTKMIKTFEANYRVKLEKNTIDVYWEMLKEYEDERVKKATIVLIRELSFLPRIADIVIAIEGNKEDEAELAWSCLIDKISDEGHYQSVSFPEYPAIGTIVERWGGWLRVCDMTFEEEKWKRIEFIKIYPIMKKRGDYPKELAGQFEIDNSNKGYNKETMLGIYGRRLDGDKVDRKLLEGGS